ncbi:Era Like 12S Mitochondrial RRNA Chaperone 1 [Mortierella claussenii]|nr:Era Like 12S Mitochondrial RRNA Chaperone 1 [Mortierella claussenii]
MDILKTTLMEKKRQLQGLSEVQASKPESASGGSTTGQPAFDPAPAKQPLHSEGTRKPGRAMPIFASPADMTVRLPKVVRDFAQPDNAEIVKIALIGSPNVGKSTIVNELVKSAVSIVSVRPHTTRERIKAVLTDSNKQIVFYDTPGVVPEKNVSRLNRELVNASWKALQDSDHLLVVMDCHKLLDHSLVTEKYIFERLGKLETNVPATLVFNKVDLLKGRGQKLQEYAQEYSQLFPNFVKIIYTSAHSPKVGMQELRSHLLSLTKPGQWLYPAYQKSDQADLSRVEDMIRAELYELLKIPYNIKQVNVGWTELEDDVLRIDQHLIVERPGQKKIIVGKDGSVIRDITINSRKAIGNALKRKIMLSLQVKVKSKKV